MDEVTPTMDETTAPADGAPESLDEALGADGQLMDEIEGTLAAEATSPPPTVQPMGLAPLAGAEQGSATVRDLDLLADVDVEVAVEFGRTRLPLRQLLRLRRGSLVELARRPEQQVTVLANGRPIALGDVVVVGDQVGVHIVELIDPDEPAPAAPPPAQVTMESDVVGGGAVDATLGNVIDDRPAGEDQ